MKPLRIAFLPIVRVQFDVPLAEEMITLGRDALLTSGFELIGPERPISDASSAESAVKALSAEKIDLVLIFQATFADSTMVVSIAEGLDAPLFLWAVPEVWTGERLRLNALCGINLAGHALTLRKKHYDYAYALPQNPAALAKVRALAMAGRLRGELKNTRLGVVGEHPAGLDTCHLDDDALGMHFGVQIEHIELEEVFQRAKATTPDVIESIRAVLRGKLENLDALDAVPVNGSLSVYQALREIASERKLDGLAVRCWPEFFTVLGCAACGAMSMMSDGMGMQSPIPCSCEADINGTLTQVMLRILADEPSFGTDIVGVDESKDRIALWHCGLAPLSMADPAVAVRGGLHSNRKLPLVMDFPLRAGKVTLARVSQATGALRLVIGEGEMLAVPKPFSGTSGTLKLDLGARGFLDLLMREGLEHHISLVYGVHTASLKAFANLIDLPTLILNKEVRT